MHRRRSRDGDDRRAAQLLIGSEPSISVAPELVRRYSAAGYWRDESLAQIVRGHAVTDPGGVAYVEGTRRLTWADYDELSDRLAGDLIAAGLPRGARVAVYLPDGPGVHVAFLAAEKAGLIVVGIGPRSGKKELEHLFRKGRATALISEQLSGGVSAEALVRDLREAALPVVAHIVVDRIGAGPGAGGRPRELIERRRMSPNELFLLNSTSGTTGLPKCVMQFQNRWWYFHQLAVDSAGLSRKDSFLALIAAPFGFGLWTAHFTPAYLGCPTTVMSRFRADEALDIIERDRPTVLMCVSTQFIMMLNAQAARKRDLSSLRVMFTGGEAVPYQRASEFEQTTGALVLQFYGSNETGTLSRTTMRDTRDQRLNTCGRVIDEMNVRLVDDEGRTVTGGRPGQPTCQGPATCMGYYDDDEANRELLTPDGWMRTGDIAEIDRDGYLRLVGRKMDVIIRGGKNVSATAVEEEVATHPAVALAAAVAMPDAVFGERVCAYVVLRPDRSLVLSELTAHLATRGVSKENLPERLIVVDALPLSPGGKVAKAELRADIRKRLEDGTA